MSKDKKDVKQIKLELEGPLRKFLEDECSLECRSLTAHVRYIINKYYLERVQNPSSQILPFSHQNMRNGNCSEQIVRSTNPNEPIIPSTNHNEPIIPSTNFDEQESDKYVSNNHEQYQESNPYEEEDYGYINQDVLDF